MFNFKVTYIITSEKSEEGVLVPYFGYFRKVLRPHFKLASSYCTVLVFWSQERVMENSVDSRVGRPALIKCKSIQCGGTASWVAPS